MNKISMVLKVDMVRDIRVDLVVIMIKNITQYSWDGERREIAMLEVIQWTLLRENLEEEKAVLILIVLVIPIHFPI